MKKDGKNKFKATIVIMTLVLSTFFVLATIPTVSALEPVEPNTFTATALSGTQIDLSWIKGSYADYTYICYAQGSTPPATRGSGIELFNNTGVSTSATSLDYGTQYSFSAWSWNQTDSLWSSSYSTDSNTTFANQVPVFGVPSPTNGSTGNQLSLTWSISINDPESNLFDWTIQCSNGQTSGVNGASGGTKSLSLSGLAYSTPYVVWVNATDPAPGSGLYAREWYTFTTKANLPPVLGTPSPTNGSTGNLLSFSWGIPINDPNGNTFTWSIQCSNGQTSGTSGTNGTKTLSLSGLAYSTTYKVWVNVTDPAPGSGLYTRGWYTFTTKGSLPPVLGTSSPANGSTGNQQSFTWIIPITDPEGDLFNWTIQCSNGQTSGVNGATGGTKSLSLSGLAYSTPYVVWVNATDPTGSNLFTRGWYTFTTKGNLPPAFGTPSPTNGSTGNSLSFIWSIPINDPNGNTFTWSIQCSNGQTSGTSGASGGTKSLTLSSLVYSTVYKVWVNATDPAPGSGLYTRSWYTFTTGVAPPATSVNPISPYWQNGVPEVTIFATNNSVRTDSVTLWYRYSSNNASWGSWTKAPGVNNPRLDIDHTPWVWTFNCPSGSGYYEFYSIGARNGSSESAPGSADARCRVTVGAWTRFGYYPVGSTSDDLTDTLQGSNFICPSSGIANNMTVWIENGGLTANAKCAIYSSDKNTLIGYTSEKTIGSSYKAWTTFNFIGEPFLVGGNQYWLVVWGNAGHTRFDYDTSYDITGQYNYTYTSTFPASISSLPVYPDKVLSLYCRYTPISKPINTNPYPANASINIPLTPSALNITVNHASGNRMNITWRTNESGSWKTMYTTPNVLSGTYYCTNTSWINNDLTKYWWSVNTNDGKGGWDNDTYYFTTFSNVSEPPSSPTVVSPANGAVGVSISPTLQVTVNDPNNDIMKVSFYSSGGTLIGTKTNVASGSSSSIVWSGRAYSTAYSWYVIVNDSKYNTTSSTWSFTTAANMPPNSPVLVGPTPGQTGVSTSPTLQVTVTDPNGGTVNVSFYSSGGTLIGTKTNVASGSSPSIVWSGRSYSTLYSWYVIVNDSVYHTTSATWSFTTKAYSGGDDGTTPSGDTTPPTTPTNVKCTTTGNDNTPSFSWTASTDASGISGYYVKIDSGTDTLVGIVTSWTSPNIIADGKHTFSVKAMDANSNVGNYGTCSFTINTTVVGKQPTADAGGPYTGAPNQTITFDGSKSTDSDGTIVGYRWDWTNDGTYDTDWLTTATTAHAYLIVGQYTVKLQVKDNTNATGTDTATVNIIVDTDADNDGLDDAVEIQLSSDPNDKSDVTGIVIDGTTYYIVDINKDGQFDTFYNPIINKSTALQLENGKYKVDIDGDGKTDHLYNPASGQTTVYKPEEGKGFPWLYIIILLIVIVIILIIAVLFKTGFLYIEKKYEDEENKK